MTSSESSRPSASAQLQDRRNDYDVTNTVRVSSVPDVRTAVQALFRETYPQASFDAVWIAFHDFERLFDGRIPGFLGCDTVYHDKQHSLDITLAMARLLAGYERSCAAPDRLGETRAVLGLITALFHDAGYIRRSGEAHRRNGAELTGWHVSRSAEFLSSYLPSVGLGELAPLAARIVHFTGYEQDPNEIELEDPLDAVVGHLVGTADLIAQAADRCYLEKCRDRLFAEFVIGGVAFRNLPQGIRDTRYRSGEDLLRQTPAFWRDTAERLEKTFNRAYRYIEPLFGDRNPYLDCIQSNLDYLERVIAKQDWRRLRRRPPCYTASPDTLETVGALVSRRLADYVAPA